jgi:multicomponent Na+:H+ antiporter subunit C
MEESYAFLVSRINYLALFILMMIGLYAAMIKKNLIKKIVGMNILQTSVIFFFISIGVKENATIPIIEQAHRNGPTIVEVERYINPLPHVLMLTAIVVAVATLGVALAMVIRIYRSYGALDEEKILDRLKQTAPDFSKDSLRPSGPEEK